MPRAQVIKLVANLTVGVKKNVRMIKIFWAHNDQKWNKNQTHNKSEVSLAVFTHTVLPSCTAGSEHTAHAPWTCMTCQTT